MPDYVPWRQLAAVTSLALTWGGVVCSQTLLNVIRRGPKQVFRVMSREVRPSALDDPELGTHAFARLKDVTLHYVARGPTDRPLVLFLHGFPELWYSWRYQLKALGENYRAVAVDMRGYGESDRPEGIGEYHIHKLTADIKQLIDHLGYTSCYLVGHDWGGLVAWMFATEYPAYVNRLVICNAPHPFLFTKYMKTSWSQLMKSWYVFLFQLPYLPEYVVGFSDLAFLNPVGYKAPGMKIENFTKTDLEVFKYTFRNFVDRTGPINYYRAVMRYKYNRLPSSKVQAPTLVIWGTRDPYIDGDFAELAKHYVKGQFELCFISGAGHFVQQDEPDIVNKYIENFLAGKNPGGMWAAKM